MSYFQSKKPKEAWSREKLELWKMALRGIGRTERQIERELKEQIRAVRDAENAENAEKPK